MKKTGIILSLTFILFLTSACDAGLFNREKQVKDEYLEKLFTPDFPYEYIKVMEDSKGRRFIVIKAKEDVGKLLGKYDKLLISRGVNIYGTFHYGDIFGFEKKTVTNYSITITRKVEGEPDTIEISQSVVKDPQKDEPIVAATARGKKIRIAIEPDFGKRWQKIKLIPDTEPEAPEPKVGRYPGAKLVNVSSYGSGRMYVFVSSASFKEIYDFYSEKLKVQYPFAKEMFSNPKAYSHNSIKLFGIGTTGREFRLYFHNKTPQGQQIAGDWADVFAWQSIDPNLSDYIQIEIRDHLK